MTKAILAFLTAVGIVTVTLMLYQDTGPLVDCLSYYVEYETAIRIRAALLVFIALLMAAASIYSLCRKEDESKNDPFDHLIG